MFRTTTDHHQRIKILQQKTNIATFIHRLHGVTESDI